MMDHERERDGVVPEEEKSWASYDEAADAAEQERGPEDHADTDTESMNTGVTEEDPEPDAPAYGGDEDAPMEEEDIAAEEEPYSGGDDEEYGEEDGAYGEEAADSEDFDFDYNEEPENLAEIAERILGARHSRASTAAPIRTRADREREARIRDALNQPCPVLCRARIRPVPLRQPRLSRMFPGRRSTRKTRTGPGSPISRLRP